MKNVFFTGMCLCFLSGCAAGYRLPPEVTAAAVGDRAQVVYSPAAGVWSEGGMAEDRTVFTGPFRRVRAVIRNIRQGKQAFRPLRPMSFC